MIHGARMGKVVPRGSTDEGQSGAVQGRFRPTAVRRCLICPMRTLAVPVAMLAILAGCTRHKPPTVDLRAVAAEDLGRADARLLDGCYACLVEARDTYARLATGPVSAQATVRRFEAELLIVLREKELAIDTAASQARLQAAGDALGPEFD